MILRFVMVTTFYSVLETLVTGILRTVAAETVTTLLDGTVALGRVRVFDLTTIRLVWPYGTPKY
jgi:hypothetical protein